MGRHAKIEVKKIETRLMRSLGDWMAFQRIPEFLYENLTYPWKDVTDRGLSLNLSSNDKMFLAGAFDYAKRHAHHVEIMNLQDLTPEKFIAEGAETYVTHWGNLQKAERRDHELTPPDMRLPERCKSFIFTKWYDYALWRDAEDNDLDVPTDPFDLVDVSPKERADLATDFERRIESINQKGRLKNAAASGPALATSGNVRQYIIDNSWEDSATKASQMPKKLLESGWMTKLAHPTDGRSYYLVPTTSEKGEAEKFSVPGRSARVQKNYLHAQAVEMMEVHLMQFAWMREMGLPEDSLKVMFADSFGPGPNIFSDYMHGAAEELSSMKKTVPSPFNIGKNDKYKVVNYWGGPIAGPPPGLGKVPQPSDD